MESLPNEIIMEIQQYLMRESLFNFRIISKLIAGSPIHTKHMINVYRRRHRTEYIHTLNLINNIGYAIGDDMSHRKIGADDVFYRNFANYLPTLQIYAHKKPKGGYPICRTSDRMTAYVGNINCYILTVRETINIDGLFFSLRPLIESGPSIKMHIIVEFGYMHMHY